MEGLFIEGPTDMSEPKGVKRKWFASGAINAATLTALKAPHSTTSTIFVTKFTISITTHAAGKLLQLQDTTGTPIVYAKHLDAAAAAGVLSTVTFDFGWGGIKMPVGLTVNGVSEASGPAGFFYAEGYEITPIVLPFP